MTRDGYGPNQSGRVSEHPSDRVLTVVLNRNPRQKLSSLAACDPIETEGLGGHPRHIKFCVWGCTKDG